MAKMPMTSGSDGPQRTDYKKTAAPKPGVAKKQNLIAKGKMGKALNSGAPSFLQMGKK